MSDWRLAQRIIAAPFFALGAGFFAAGLAMDEEVMPAVFYGDAVSRYPAEWWAVAVMVASLLVLCGTVCLRPILAPALVIAGSALHVMVLAALARAGLAAPQGLHLALWAGAALMPFAAFLFRASRDLVLAFRGAAHGRNAR